MWNKTLQIILLLVFYSCTSLKAQVDPLVVVIEKDPRLLLNPTVVLYTDGTLIKNKGDEFGAIDYRIYKLDSIHFNEFMDQLDLERLAEIPSDYDCAPYVSDRNENQLIYFGKDTIQIDVYGWFRRDAFLIKHPEEFPDAKLQECMPIVLSETLGELLYFDGEGENWTPQYFYDNSDGKTNRFKGDRLSLYLQNFHSRVRYEFPGDKLWINR